MKKKSILAMALSLAVVSSFSACGDFTTVNYDVPTYADDKQITIGAWSGSRHDLTDAELYNLKQAGFNLLVGLRPEKVTETEALDRCAEFGINVLLDQRPGAKTPRPSRRLNRASRQAKTPRPSRRLSRAVLLDRGI